MSGILIYGIGNPGRQDDSLGVAFATKFEEWATSINLSIDIDYNFQLSIEDAARISGHKLVIFVDASKEKIEDYCLTRIQPVPSSTATTHSISPESILFLCKELFDLQPAAFIVHIKGYEWEFGEPLTEKAQNNLAKAIEKMKNILQQDLPIEEIIKNLDNIVLNLVKL